MADTQHPLTEFDRTVITRRVQADCAGVSPPMPQADVDAAVRLALDLYATAARHGLDRDDANGVTSFVAAAIDGVRLTRRRSAKSGPSRPGRD